MHPYLFDWVVNGHHLRPPTYGVMLAISFSAAYFLALRRSLILEESPRHVENLFLGVIFGSVLGGRLFHVFFEEWAYYSQHVNKIFAVWEGGYTFYGALLGAAGTMYLYCRLRKLSFLQYVDIAAEGVTFGLFMGRMGCFGAGCCWGKPTTMPWGVIFSNPESFANVHDTPLHPTQLYESFGALCIFLYVFWLFKRRRYEGQVFFHAVTLYAILRFVIEFFRGDDYRGFIFGGLLSYSQFVSVVLLLFALSGMAAYSRKRA